MSKVRRNTLAVRLNDKEHEAFMSTNKKSYSPILRELIRVYSENAPDESLPPREKVKKALENYADKSSR